MEELSSEVAEREERSHQSDREFRYDGGLS